MSKSTKIGSQIYTPFTLKLYDWWVLKMSNHFAWKCPTHDVLVPHFTEYAGNEHLDIGVGTGFYLTHLPETTHISDGYQYQQPCCCQQSHWVNTGQGMHPA